MYPFKKTTTKVYFEVTPEIENFLKWHKASGLSDKRSEFGVYLNNHRYPIKTDAYLEIDVHPTNIDLYDVLCAFLLKS